MNMQSTNTLAAENDVTATDYGQATSDMSKYPDPEPDRHRGSVAG